jgi:hypothetical protein
MPKLIDWFGFMMLKTTFNNILWQVSFIGRGNRTTRRKPPTCRKSLTNFITKLIDIWKKKRRNLVGSSCEIFCIR